MILSPPYAEPAALGGVLRERGYAVVSPGGVRALTGCTLPELEALRPSWQTLPPDEYLRDGGKYRRRRHSCFVVRGDEVQQAPHRAHWQPLEYNALHGGMHRWFAPMQPADVAQPAWQRILLSLSRLWCELKGAQPWYVEAHQFRIDTTHGIGRPTPEGAHRDGVSFVAVFLVAREQVKGGETRVFDALGPAGERFTLTEPWSVLLLDDERVIHETTPIQPTGPDGHRDTLVLTWRERAFQGD
jgi:hypothetical protein